MARSESGAEGVFFVETPVGAIVVKGSRSLGSEFFASLLSLRLGVLAPRSRVLSTNSEEGLSATLASARLTQSSLVVLW